MRIWIVVALSLWTELAWGQGFDYEALTSLVLDGQKAAQAAGTTLTIDALLPNLPASFRASYTLMYRSKSLQEASYLSPRVIMFGTDARLTCAFNGDPAQVGYDSLECLQFRLATRSFEFHQIVFPSAANGLSSVLFAPANTTNGAKPPCTACHGADPRPNWAAYDDWEGAYGGYDDGLERTAGDEAAYAQFTAARPNHPRYRFLIQDADAHAPYLNGDPLAIDRRPNLRFSDLGGRMNALRTSRLAAARLASWETLAFAAGALGCQLSADQKLKLAAAGRQPPSLDLAPLYAKIAIPVRDWTTATSPTPDGAGYNHQSGFSFLEPDTAMGVVAQAAQDGDKGFQDALAQIAAQVPEEAPFRQRPFFQTLEGILPTPDLPGRRSDAAVAAVCPELTDRLVDDFLKHGG